MSVIRSIIAGLYVAAAALCSSGQANADEREDALDAEKDFHLAQSINGLPAHISKDKWERAFGVDGREANPAYIAPLLNAYKAAPGDQTQLVDRFIWDIAKRVIKKGDAAMFLLLVDTMIAPDKPLRRFGNPFANRRAGFEISMRDVGKMLKVQLALLNPDAAERFRENLALATVGSVIERHVDGNGKETYGINSPDFIRFFLGYQLLKHFAIAENSASPDNDQNRNMHFLRSEAGRYKLNVESLTSFLDENGTSRFAAATSRINQDSLPAFIVLFDSGISGNANAAEALGNIAESWALIGNTGTDFFDTIYAASELTNSDTLAAQIATSAFAQRFENTLTPSRMYDIFERVYVLGQKDYKSKSARTAKYKILDKSQEEEMRQKHLKLLTKLITKPENYYRMHADFWWHDVFNSAASIAQLRMQPTDVATHFGYLGKRFLDDSNAQETTHTSHFLKGLVEMDSKRSDGKAMHTDLLIPVIEALLKEVRGHAKKTNRLVLLLKLAANDGWQNLVNEPVIAMVRSKLNILPNSHADEDLKNIERNLMDARALTSRWEAKVKLPAPKK